MTEFLEPTGGLKAGRTFEIDGQKWLVLRVSGGRAEIKRLGAGEILKVRPNRKARRKLWAKIRRKAKRGKK